MDGRRALPATLPTASPLSRPVEVEPPAAASAAMSRLEDMLRGAERPGILINLFVLSSPIDEETVLLRTSAAVRNWGGPLTNHVNLSRRGRMLRLNYELLGKGGAYEMAMVNFEHPPEFRIQQGERTLVSGKFEYG